MRKVISASRRTDLVAHFPDWLASVLREEKTLVFGPSGRLYSVDLKPESVHTLVLWSKDFTNLILDADGLREIVRKYDQLYFHHTVTGLGGSFIERSVPPPPSSLHQLEALVKIAGSPARISLRFDPVVFWKEKGKLRSNLSFFETLATAAGSLGITHIRFSFTQWYGKAVKRAARHGFCYVDLPSEEKIDAAHGLARIAESHKLSLFACSQNFLSGIPGIEASSCIDGRLLRDLHPRNEPVSQKKDGSQRKECFCTESLDIGSYRQSCPHSCLYCYANTRI